MISKPAETLISLLMTSHHLYKDSIMTTGCDKSYNLNNSIIIKINAFEALFIRLIKAEAEALNYIFIHTIQIL